VSERDESPRLAAEEAADADSAEGRPDGPGIPDGDSQESTDVVQAVAEFVDDLVDPGDDPEDA
jgi:hypothetical protein